MDESQMYIMISIVVLSFICILALFIGRKRQSLHLSKLTTISFSVIIAGILFGENRLIGYSFIGMGLTFAFIDIFQKMRKQNR
jgi:hypothetical protein